MALTKEKKQEIVDQVTGVLEDTKITVLAHYDGVSVQAMQDLRRKAKDSDTSVRVIKNSLFIKALKGNDKLKDFDSSLIEGQLFFAFNDNDEIAPAQVLSDFARSGQSVKFVGAIASDGSFISSEDVQAMASLPNKEQLRGQLVGMLSAPLSGFVNTLNSNLRGVMNVFSAHADNIS